MKLESEPVVVGAVGKVKIPPLRGDFQAQGESPACGLFHGAAFSTALLPTNCATEPFLFAPDVALSCLDGSVAKQKLNLFQFAS